MANQASVVVAVLGIGVMGLGTLLHIIAMATPAWSVLGKTLEVGPWKMCQDSVCTTYDKVTDDDIKSVRTCTVLGVLAAIGAIIFTVVAAILNGTSKANIAKIFSILVIVAAGVAFLCIFIGFVKWGKLSEGTLGYSFALTVIGSLLIGGGGLIAGIGGMFGKKK